LVEAAHERIAEVGSTRVIVRAIELIVYTAQHRVAAIHGAVIRIIAIDIDVHASARRAIT